mmetsp:Transcript_40431/g.53219  ORF Transcript_40431/g.53219 Transcript_40431/m.53219 type:complete len:261 (+) Transcript_40431:69-851(+)
MDCVQKYLGFHYIQKNRNTAFNHPKALGKIGLGGSAIGFLFGVHLTALVANVILCNKPSFFVVLWCVYMCCLAAFHFMEFLTTALYNPATLSYDSWIITHSAAYTMACFGAWIEFWVEVLFFPGLKSWEMWWVALAGLAVVLVGQTFRSGAMWTAKGNFNHIIATEKAQDHKLVTHGVYRYFRHPSYFGFFWWSVGMQVLLVNPVCVVLYAVASWKFFKDRIPYEERMLCNFFAEYPQYMKTTYIGIPFISSPLSERKAQ